jgi:hypothetical protein
VPRSLETPDIQCSECKRSVDEFTAIKERWGYWSDGYEELLPLCPECAKAPDAPASGLSASRSASRGDLPPYDPRP